MRRGADEGKGSRRVPDFWMMYFTISDVNNNNV